MAKLNFVLNERKYAEDILSSNNLGDNARFALKVLSKYYVASGLDDKQIREALKKILTERVQGVSNATYNKWVKKSIETAHRGQLTEIDEITISKPELDIVNALDSKYDPTGVKKGKKPKINRLSRLAFGILVLSKLAKARGNADGWYNIRQRDLFVLSCPGTTTDTQDKLLGNLIDRGIIQTSRKLNHFAVRFLPLQDGEPVIHVTNIDNTDAVYRQYRGERFFMCVDCGKMVRVTNGRGRRCKECATRNNREKARERMRARLHLIRNI